MTRNSHLIGSRRWGFGVGFGACLVGMASLFCSAPAFAIGEDAMRAAYIKNIIKFVNWPATAMAPNPAKVVVCVRGEERFNSMANELEKQQAKGATIVVVDGNKASVGASCNVLYIGPSEMWRARTILAEIGSAPVLTIGENDLFAQDGGMIEFVVEGERLGFKINHAAATRVGLAISSQLLKLAKKVYK